MVQAVSFDAIGDRYSRSASGLVLTTTSITWCCWVKLATDRNSYAIVLASDDGVGGSATNYVGFGASGGGTAFYTTGVTGGAQAATFNFTVGTWTFIAGTYDRTNTDNWIYYAEAPATTLTREFVFTPVTGWNNANTFYIGASNAGFNNDWWEGSIAQVKVWNAVLTQAELTAEAAADSLVRTADAWAYYSFRSGLQTNDESGQGRTLTAGTATADASGPPIGGPPPPLMFLKPTRSTVTFA